MFDINDNGPVNLDPLVAWGLRYHLKPPGWRRIERYEKGLPAIIGRANVAKEIGVAEELVERWENAIRESGRGLTRTAAEMLRVERDGTVNADPLAQWNLRFYPSSRVWRRTRSHRNEVPRSEVAKKVGVPESALAAWEAAIAIQAREAAKD